MRQPIAFYIHTRLMPALRHPYAISVSVSLIYNFESLSLYQNSKSPKHYGYRSFSNDSRAVTCNGRQKLTFIFILVYTFVYILVYTFVYILVYTFVYIVVYTFVYTLVYTFVYIVVYTFVYIVVYTLVYILVYTFVYIVVYTFVYIVVYTLVYILVYITHASGESVRL